MTGELEAMRQQLQSLADTLVGDFDGEHDASAALIAKASDMMLTLQATVERQAAEIGALRAMLEQAEDDLERARTVIDRVRATVGDHNG